MFCLRWFKSPCNADDKPPIREGPMMDMPDLVMRKIVADIDLLSILRLRRVCHAFRNFIDDMKLDYGINHIIVDISPFMIRVTLYKLSAYFVFRYVRVGRSCLQITGTDYIFATEFLVNESFVDAFSNDIGAILRNQNARLDRLSIVERNYTRLSYIKFDMDVVNNCLLQSIKTDDGVVQYLSTMNKNCRLKPTADDVYDSLEKILKSRDHPIHIQNMTVAAFTSQRFLSVARCIDMKKLINFEATSFNKELTLDGIVELNDWECIPNLVIIDFKITLPIEIFLHKLKLKIKIPTITTEDVLLIKNKFMNSPQFFEYYTIFYNHLADEDELHIALGHSDSSFNVRHWSFEIPETNRLLKVRQDSYSRSFSFYW